MIDFELPWASVGFNSHANRASMMTVGIESNFASEDDGIQISFLGHVRVCIRRHHLRQRA